MDGSLPGSSSGSPTYCICNDPIKGGMIQCNNRACQIGFFHHSCVSISIRTKGIWYCPSCRANFQNYRIGKVDVQPIIPDPNSNNKWQTVFCFCQKLKPENMIGCDNTQCHYKWFHYPCVNIKTKPEEKWYCRKCRASPNISNIPRPGTISYDY